MSTHSNIAYMISTQHTHTHTQRERERERERRGRGREGERERTMLYTSHTNKAAHIDRYANGMGRVKQFIP